MNLREDLEWPAASRRRESTFTEKRLSVYVATAGDILHSMEVKINGMLSPPLVQSAVIQIYLRSELYHTRHSTTLHAESPTRPVGSYPDLPAL